MTPEFIIENVIQGGAMNEIGRKIIAYNAKEKAIQDAIMALRDNNQLTVQDTMATIRGLAKRQFKNEWKANQLIAYASGNRM